MVWAIILVAETASGIAFEGVPARRAKVRFATHANGDEHVARGSTGARVGAWGAGDGCGGTPPHHLLRAAPVLVQDE